MKKQIAVIGLGRFGTSLATTLFNIGHDVLALDEDEDELSLSLTMLGNLECSLRESLEDSSMLNDKTPLCSPSQMRLPSSLNDSSVGNEIVS